MKEANASVMATVDWLALVFASYVIGLTIAGEVKDIQLCGIAAERAGENIAPRWRQALSFLSGIRRWVFLTAFGWIVPNLVALKGGDALNVCFNTIAMVSPVQSLESSNFLAISISVTHHQFAYFACICACSSS